MVRQHTGAQSVYLAAARRYKPNLTFDLPLTFFVVAGAIAGVEQGQAIEKVAVQYPASDRGFEKMIYRCSTLVGMQTATGVMKLIDRAIDVEAKHSLADSKVLLPRLQPFLVFFCPFVVCLRFLESPIDRKDTIRKGRHNTLRFTCLIPDSYALLMSVSLTIAIFYVK